MTLPLDGLIAKRAKPAVIALDHGIEFTGRHFHAWVSSSHARSGPDAGTGRNYQFPCRISFARRSIAACPDTRIPTTLSVWPRTRRFARWPRASGRRLVSRSHPPYTGSKRMSSPMIGTTKGSRASIRSCCRTGASRGLRGTDLISGLLT